MTQHVIRRIREAFGSDLYVGVQASAALGKESRSIYQDAHAANKRAWGQWTIFDHCLPLGVTRATGSSGLGTLPIGAPRRGVLSSCPMVAAEQGRASAATILLWRFIPLRRQQLFHIFKVRSWTSKQVINISEGVGQQLQELRAIPATKLQRSGER